MQCLTQLTPPTAVTHCVSLPFLSASANNLVVAKSSLLQVFSLKSIVSDTPDTAEEDEQGEIKDPPVSKSRAKAAGKERTQTTKLVLIAQYELSGIVTALSRVKPIRSKSGGEAILVALRDAKLSLAEWDPQSYGISTISIHYYEREDLHGPPWTPLQSASTALLTVEPGSRCAALKFGARHIAILPFHQAGDDLVMEEYDSATNESELRTPDTPSKPGPGDISTQTVCGASFVLSLLALDPTLHHPIHLAFLHGYREPTFGILSAKSMPSSSLLQERRDLLSYTVYTLDLEQRESTTLTSITGLPSDLHKILALPSPIGGALLVGFNQLIHVDQAGKTAGVAVNEFASKSTSYPLYPETHLGLRLENCLIEPLGSPNGDMLIVMVTGELALLHFKLDGRSVTRLSIRPITQVFSSLAPPAGASCAANVGRGRLFIGSEEGDSVVLGWTLKPKKARRLKPSTDANAELDLSISDLEEEELGDDDDLYSEAKPLEQALVPAKEVEPDDYSLRVHDSIINLAPLGNIASTSIGTASNKNYPSMPKPELVVSTGRGRSSFLCKLSRALYPVINKQYNVASAQAAWSVIKKPSSAKTKASMTSETHMENLIIASVVDDMGEEQSHLYSWSKDELEELINSDFDPTAGASIAVTTFDGGSRIVQVLKNEVRVYDDEFSLSQIHPLSDDTSSSQADANVVTVSFAEPYILLIRDDLSLIILRSDHTGELEEVELSNALSSGKWISGSLLEDSNDVFRLDAEEEEQDEDGGSILIFLLSDEGGLKIFRASNLSRPAYHASGLSLLPPYLSEDFVARRLAAKAEIVEILVVEIGDYISRSPVLMLRTITDDVIIYQPYQVPKKTSNGSCLRLLKSSTLPSPKTTSADAIMSKQSLQLLQVVHDLDGYSAIFRLGPAPCIIIKPATSPPQAIPIKLNYVRSVSNVRVGSKEHHLLFVNEMGTLISAQLPTICQPQKGAQPISGWVIDRLYGGEEINAFDYHAAADRYALGTSKKIHFKLPEDNVLHPEWSEEGNTFLPHIDQDTLKILDPITRAITDSHEFDIGESIMCMKTMNLVVSEHTLKRKHLVVVGTALIAGEDLPTKGRIYVFDIIDVVPEPEHPETHLKLKLFAREEVKGAITAITPVGTEGFFLAAQGQKCMVRGLKEDGTVLPVAFLDTPHYTSVAKELPGTGLCIIADVIKGIWFVGYREEPAPYQFKSFGKCMQHVETITAEFLPDGNQLYFVVGDPEGILHVMQYEPHNPKSLQGHRLLQLSTFNTGAYPSTMTLLPQISPPQERKLTDSRSPDAAEPLNGRYMILITSQTGAISLLTSLSLSDYRTLSALQAYLTNTISHPLALNAKAYRAVEADSSIGGRAILDGDILKKWMDLASWKRVEGVSRAGAESEWEMQRLLNKIMGVGVGLLDDGASG